MAQIKWFTLLLSILVGGCATSNKSIDDVGEWIPLMDDNEEVEFSKEFGILGSNNIFEGMAFWEDSPYYKKPPYSFHWYGNKLRIWVPYKDKKDTWAIVKYELDVDKCEGLAGAIETLKQEIKHSALKMVDDGPILYQMPIVMSPIFYKIKLFPPNMLGSIILNNIKNDGVSWIEEAENVKSISSICTQS